MAILQRKSAISELNPEDSNSVVAGMSRIGILKTLQNNDNKVEGQDEGKRPTLVDDEIERLIDLAYAHGRNHSGIGWNNMWTAVLGRLFPSDRYDITKEPRKISLWTFDFLFVTRKQDSRKVLMALCFNPIPRNQAGFPRKRMLVRSFMTDVGKEEQPGGRMYCLGLVGTDFSWGWMEDEAMEGMDPAIEWEDFDLSGSHGSLHRLAEHVGGL